MCDVADGRIDRSLNLVRHKRADNLAEQFLILDEEERDENDRKQSDGNARDLFSIALGFYKTNPWLTALLMLLGKFLRFLFWNLLLGAF